MTPQTNKTPQVYVLLTYCIRVTFITLKIKKGPYSKLVKQVVVNIYKVGLY